MVLFLQFELKIAVHAALTKKKTGKWTTFLRRVNPIFMFFRRRVSFPYKCGKAIFRQSRRLKSQNFPLHMNHGYSTDYSKLVNLCPVKHFSLLISLSFILFFSLMSLPETRCYNATATLSLWTPEQKFASGNIQCFSWSCSNLNF